jgi:hypothetical protein
MNRFVATGWVGLAVAVLVALSAAVTRVPVAVSATRAQVTTVHGIEIVPEHTEGTFTGYSTGSLPGDWVAVVKHTPLSPNATITGGTLTLATRQRHKTRTLTGQFSSGTITNTNQPGRELHQPDLPGRRQPHPLQRQSHRPLLGHAHALPPLDPRPLHQLLRDDQRHAHRRLLARLRRKLVATLHAGH